MRRVDSTLRGCVFVGMAGLFVLLVRLSHPKGPST